MVIMKNKIPDILRERNIKISEFHTRLVRGGENTRLSYPKAHELATVTTLTDTMALGPLRRAAVILGVSLNDIVEFETIPD